MKLQDFLTRHCFARALAAGLAAGLAAFALHTAGALEPVERVLYDARVRAAPRASCSRLVEIVEIDQYSVDVMGHVYKWGRFGNWPRHKLCGLLAKGLADHGARAVVLDLFIDFPASAEEDEALAGLLAEAKRVVVPVQLYESRRPYAGSARPGPGNTGAAHIPGDLSGPEYQAAAWPINIVEEGFRAEVARSVAAIGAANVPKDPDGVMRRSQPASRFAGTRVWSLAAAGVWVAQDGAFPEAALRGHILSWRGDPFDPERFHRETAHTLWASLMAERKGKKPPLDLERYRGKVVVVGGTAQATYDHLATPFGDRPGLVAHAVAIENLLEGRAVRRTSPSFALAACLALACACALAVARGRRIWLAALAAGALLALFAAASSWLLARHDLWIDLAAPGAAGLLGVTASGVVGYVFEGRRLREFRAEFARHLSAEVVEEIARDIQSVRPGTCARREIAVLFADVRDFTTLSERSTPEAVVERLNEFMAPMSEAILEARGLLNKYLGDGIMAFWGAPQGVENPAAAALGGIRGMLRALARLQAAWRVRGQPVLEVGVGLHVGAAVVGMVGGERRVEYTAIGDTVNLAARLEPQTKVFGVRVVVSEAVTRAAPDAAEYRRLGTVQVKGRGEPVTVYEAVFPGEG